MSGIYCNHHSGKNSKLFLKLPQSNEFKNVFGSQRMPLHCKYISEGYRYSIGILPIVGKIPIEAKGIPNMGGSISQYRLQDFPVVGLQRYLH